MLAAIVAVALTTAPSTAERATIFKVAGFTPTAGRYLACDGQSPLGLQTRDINGDGRMDALVADQGLECYGNTGTGFTLLTKTAKGRWTKLYQSPGVPKFLRTRANGWPEIEVGLPGFCFPILRWTGTEFSIARREYEGKACKL